MVVNINPATNDAIDNASCQNGTPPEGMRAIITIEEEKAIMLAQTDTGASGFAAAVVIMINDSIIGIVIGNIKDWASCGSSFTTLPTAANNDA